MVFDFSICLQLPLNQGFLYTASNPCTVVRHLFTISRGVESAAVVEVSPEESGVIGAI